MTFSPTYLPQELVDTIIDYIHDDPSSLRSCALVCKTWLPSSRLHLFAKVSLKAPALQSPAAQCPPQDRCRRLFRVLSRSPSIEAYIHELEICEGSPLNPTHHHPDARSTAWVTTEGSLVLLLEKLTHLKRLDFAATAPLSWKALPATFQHAMHALLALPSLTYVRLHSWYFPSFASLASPLSRCQNLQGLALSLTTFGEEREAESGDQPQALSPPEQDDSALQVSSSRLEVLTLDYVSCAYLEHWLLSHRSTVDVMGLRELRVAHFPDATVIKRLMREIGSSLEHFHLKPGIWDVQPFDLGSNCGIRSVRLTLDDNEKPENAMGWAMAVLSGITRVNVVERIGLEFFVDLKKVEGWVGLDSLLIQEEFSSLRQVDIGLFALPSHAEFLKVKEALSGLESRGVLRLYQLGVKSQRSSRQLTPRISGYES